MAKNEHLKQVLDGIKFRYRLKTQKDIANQLGYESATYLSDMIGGKCRISEDFSDRLKQTFGVNPNFLITGEGEIWINEMINPLSSEDVSTNFSSETEKLLHLLERSQKQIDAHLELARKKDEQMDRLIGIIEKSTNK